MNKKIIQSTSILLIGGIITKVLGLLIKIVMTREIGIEGISLYSLILPTFSFAITISQIGLPITLSRFVALNNKNNRNLYFSILPITFLINIIISFLLIIYKDYIGITLLKNKNTPLLIEAIALVIPMTTLSSILRSYFFGKEKMIPHTLSNIIENITRLFLIMIIIPFIKNNSVFTVFIIILLNIISEGISSLILFINLPKNIHIKKLSFERIYLKETFKESIPNITSNLIGSISYFLEPIIITLLLTNNHFSLSYITREYGVIHGYIYPLLMIPSFFSIAISQSIMPHITRLYQEKKKEKLKKAIKNIVLLLIVFAIIPTLIYLLLGDKLLLFLYKTNLGYSYLKIITPFFLLHYIEHPLSFCLYAFGKTKDLLKVSILSFITKYTLLFLLSNYFNGIYIYIGSVIGTMIISILYLIYKTNKYINFT